MPDVTPPFGTFDDLKERLKIRVPAATSDGDLVDLLTAAFTEWDEWVGPVPDPLPANVRELILADVVGYYSATQRGQVARAELLGRADGPRAAPMAMFPRIRAYARDKDGQASGAPSYAFPPVTTVTWPG